MELPGVNIKIDLNGLIAELQRAVQRSVNLVSVGLASSVRIDTIPKNLPGSFMSFTPAESAKWNIDTAKSEFTNWILINGFRDSTESIGAFLESAYKVVCFWKLSGKRNEKGQVVGEDWNEFVVDRPRRFHRLGLPDKIKKLEELGPIVIDQDMTDIVLSINQARNCLVHRLGIVSKRDFNREDGLEVKWRVLRLKGEHEGKDFVIEGPTHVEAGTQISVQNQNLSRVFNLNEAISFSTGEFNDLSWTLFAFGNSIKASLENYGYEFGHLERPKDEIHNQASEVIDTSSAGIDTSS